MLMFWYRMSFLNLKINIMHKYIAPRKAHKSYIKYRDAYLLYCSSYVNYKKLIYGSESYSNIQ